MNLLSLLICNVVQSAFSCWFVARWIKYIVGLFHRYLKIYNQPIRISLWRANQRQLKRLGEASANRGRLARQYGGAERNKNEENEGSDDHDDEDR